MLKQLLFKILIISLLPALSWAQSKQVTGKVTSKDDGNPLPGVNVLVMGTTRGTNADAEGFYSLEAEPGSSLVFSFIGYKTISIPVGSQTVIDVTLEADITTLQEIVVVGYGTQREKDLTSSIVTVKTEDIVKAPTNQAMQALQGKIPGVQIVSSGAPGSGPTVRVRGIGSLPDQGSSDPLYVVDGMFCENIDFLNTADIETLSVLKDASAKSIYGSRGANGVILITTKSGSYNKKAEITYDGYYGAQIAQNVLKMANSEQFTNYALATGSAADASFIDRAFQRYGRSRVNPNVPNVNTDWFKEVLRPASVQNHSINVTGGKENVQYSMGVSYFNQEGLLEVIRNKYERLNFRTKIDFKVSERLTVGGTVNISNSTQFRADNDNNGEVWFNTYFAVPILPVFDEQNTAATPLRLANAQKLGYRNPQNPFFTMYNADDRRRIGNILGNFYFDYQLIPKKLAFKTAYSYNFQNNVERNVDFNYNDGVTARQNAIVRKSFTDYNQISDNTLTYTENFGNHNLTVMAGYLYRSNVQESAEVRGQGILGFDRNAEQTWYIPSGQSVDVGNSKDGGVALYYSSYIGRVAYNYNDRYLFYSTFRRDGTNAIQKKSDNFITFGGGWVVSEESFFKAPFVDFLKLRGSWGQSGNDKIRASVGQPTVSSTSTAIDNTLSQGLTVNPNYDFVNQWETNVETNLGLTSALFKNRLTIDIDYFVRNTKNAVIPLRLPGSSDLVRRNAGEFRNSGLEAAANWSGQVSSSLSYRIGGNFATLKNEVTNLGGQQYIDAGQAEFRQRSIVGNSINAFYGYEVEGVFQNQQEIRNSGYTAAFITEKNLVAGDFKYKDQNGDGVIDGADRVVIGKILPSITYGFNMGATYKNLDLSVNFQGQAGHDILNRKRGEIIFTTDTNIDAELATNLWTGEGTSNKYPSAAGLRKGWNQSMSQYYVEKGAYFRIQNVRLSYRLANKNLLGISLPDTRFVFTAERPLTVFNYNGFNPEVADGIDRQTYPIPAVYTFGLSVKF